MLLVEKYNNIVIPDSVSSLELNDIHQKLIDEERKESPKKELPEQLKNNKFHLLAAAVNTREPVRRTVLEVSAFDLPELAAAIITKRPEANIIEILLRSLYTSSATALNPKILTGVINTLGRIFTPKEHHDNLLNIARFQREELESLENFQKGIERLEEEAEDQEFMAGLATSQSHKEKHLNEANQIRDFKRSFKASEENLELAKKIKNLSILGDSIEGAIWGFAPIFNNVIVRRMLLKQDGFTGLEGDHRKKFKGYNPIQKLGMALGMSSGALINSIMLPLSSGKNTPFAKWIKGWQDLHHGIYPKLGLLLSNLAIPINISRVSAAQSKAELRETLMLITMVASSWCFGHKITEDQISKLFNNHLKQKHNINEDILIKKDQRFPESTEIQEILHKVGDNKALEKDAIRMHSWRTFLGIKAHSLLVFIARLTMDTITKRLGEK